MTPEKLKERRMALKLSITGMAKILKTPQSTYWKWEKGQRRIPGIVEIALDGIEFKQANLTTRGRM
jgi:DNA-binding transcriptional regulator YiaG